MNTFNVEDEAGEVVTDTDEGMMAEDKDPIVDRSHGGTRIIMEMVPIILIRIPTAMDGVLETMGEGILVTLTQEAEATAVYHLVGYRGVEDMGHDRLLNQLGYHF